MQIGQLSSDRWKAGEGSINIDANRYNFRINESAETLLSIYDTDNGHSLLNCTLSLDSASRFSEEKLLNADTCSLLLGLCWFLAAPAVVREVFAA